MARSGKCEYVNCPIPRDHIALIELDAFCEEEGGITRADAAKMILVAWAKTRRGLNTSVWPAQPQAQVVHPQVEEPAAPPARRLRASSNAAAVDLDL